jgi:hypothetical protein
MGEHAEIAQARRNGSAYVVQPPRLQFCLLPMSIFQIHKIGPGGFPKPRLKAAHEVRHFWSAPRCASYVIGKAKLRPAETADFLAPLPSRNKQANDGAIVQIAGVPPNEGKLIDDRV